MPTSLMTHCWQGPMKRHFLMYYGVPFGKALWKAMICINRDPLTSVILSVYDKT